VLDHRTALDVGERFSWEACRSVASGNDGDDVERNTAIDRNCSRRRGHDE
jgi:hypothetical protein